MSEHLDDPDDVTLGSADHMVFTSEGRAVGVGSDENAAPCLPLTRASKTRPIAHAVAPFA